MGKFVFGPQLEEEPASLTVDQPRGHLEDMSNGRQEECKESNMVRFHAQEEPAFKNKDFQTVSCGFYH